MLQDTQRGTAQAVDYGWVNIFVEAYAGWLTVTVEVQNTTLTLPANHRRVHTDESDAIPGCSGFRRFRRFEDHPTPQGRFQATEIIGDRFEFGAYSAQGDSHKNSFAQTLLNCFTDEDRKLIVSALDELAAKRSAWWNRAVAQRAASLGKKIDELNEEDLRLLVTKDGYRNYTRAVRTAGQEIYRAFRINRSHFEAELQLLLDRLLDEALVVS